MTLPESNPYYVAGIDLTEIPNSRIDLENLTPIQDSEKLDFIYQVALEAKKLIDEVHPQVAPILASLEKNPMLKMFLKK